MISAQQQAEFEQLFPFIRQADSSFVKNFYAACRYLELPVGRYLTLFDPSKVTK